MHLHKRDWGDDSWSTSGGARWAFFAIFFVLVILVIVGTIRVNKKRTQRGVQPIYGTRWMTPPSYRQSQHQYNQPNGRDPDDPQTYVPTYTATANEYDMGFYDNSGNFHPNPNAKSGMTPQFPESVHHRQYSTTDAEPVSADIPHNNTGAFTVDDDDIDDHDMFARPTGPPPTTRPTPANEISSQLPGSFEPPSGPPPGAEPIEGSSRELDSVPSIKGSVSSSPFDYEPKK